MQGRFTSSHIVRGVLLAGAVASLAGPGCGDDESDDESDGAGGAGPSTTSASGPNAGGGGQADPGGELEVLHPDAPPLPGQTECIVEIRRNIPVPAAGHLEICTQITYPTNPPSGGDHWPRWAAFASYDEPVRSEILVHDLEHGAIAMLHDCADCGDAIVDAFESARTAHGIDQKCVSSGAVARFIVAPHPELDFPLAMAAWGATYNATCIDLASIDAFVEAHYAGGPEDTCASGIDPHSVDCP